MKMKEKKELRTCVHEFRHIGAVRKLLPERLRGEPCGVEWWIQFRDARMTADERGTSLGIYRYGRAGSG